MGTIKEQIDSQQQEIDTITSDIEKYDVETKERFKTLGKQWLEQSYRNAVVTQEAVFSGMDTFKAGVASSDDLGQQLNQLTAKALASSYATSLSLTNVAESKNMAEALGVDQQEISATENKFKGQLENSVDKVKQSWADLLEDTLSKKDAAQNREYNEQIMNAVAIAGMALDTAMTVGLTKFFTTQLFHKYKGTFSGKVNKSFTKSLTDKQKELQSKKDKLTSTISDAKNKKGLRNEADFRKNNDEGIYELKTITELNKEIKDIENGVLEASTDGRWNRTLQEGQLFLAANQITSQVGKSFGFNKTVNDRKKFDKDIDPASGNNQIAASFDTTLFDEEAGNKIGINQNLPGQQALDDVLAKTTARVMADSQHTMDKADDSPHQWERKRVYVKNWELLNNVGIDMETYNSIMEETADVNKKRDEQRAAALQNGEEPTGPDTRQIVLYEKYAGTFTNAQREIIIHDPVVYEIPEFQYRLLEKKFKAENGGVGIGNIPLYFSSKKPRDDSEEYNRNWWREAKKYLPGYKAESFNAGGKGRGGY
ncbi:hypothetical protein CS022_22190 [Veronia nyctiphanis]|uniref:Uncharacterized protein n=1 Tax=Veronia nyctiphanis TaxID=1278244 RepID=A0A4Q0YNZ4_9GAMM|nr:hypothetical protein [Veronia nyctiphanis]RXJ70841.1 hypothetical protein CS022_22190 [Veronia nyctiphanis]